MDIAEELLVTIQCVAKKLRDFKTKEIENNEFKDISFTSFRYIEEINNLTNPTFAELTSRLGVSKPTVTLMITKLIENGYIRKSQSGDDARIYKLSLTSKGNNLIKNYNKVYRNFVAEISQNFDDGEMRQLIELLKRI